MLRVEFQPTCGPNGAMPRTTRQLLAPRLLVGEAPADSRTKGVVNPPFISYEGEWPQDVLVPVPIRSKGNS